MTTQELIEAAVKRIQDELLQNAQNYLHYGDVEPSVIHFCELINYDKGFWVTFLRTTLLSLATTVREGTKAECVKCVPKSLEEGLTFEAGLPPADVFTEVVSSSQYIRMGHEACRKEMLMNLDALKDRTGCCPKCFVVYCGGETCSNIKCQCHL